MKEGRYLRKVFFFWAIVLVAFLMPGCSGDDDDDASESGDDLLKEACEHMVEGPGESVTASADGVTDVPDVSTHHTRFDVALADVDGGKGGFVSYAAEEEGDYVVFLSEDMSVGATDASGAEVLAVSSESGTAPCDEVATAVTFELGVGTYTLELGPASATSVSVVIEGP